MGGDSDRAGLHYWNDLWKGASIPRAVDPNRPGLWHAPHRQFHRFYVNHLLPGVPTRGKRLLEIGAARSEWLPYFAKTWGFCVTGLDYSLSGAEQCREVLLVEGIRGHVVCADFRDPPEDMIGAFDVVTSFGVIEHFDNTERALGDAAAFLRPGGILLTVIPNMNGIIGALQKSWNQPVYDIHVALDRYALLDAHRNAGLKVKRCEYLITLPLGVANLHGLPENRRTHIKRFTHYWMQVASASIWWVEERLFAVAPGRQLAGYVICVAQKPD
jgi:SAM-dependent methyltransferase